MANNKPTEENRTSIDEVNDTLTGIGEKVQSNPKVVVWSCIAVTAVVALILLYVYVIRQPAQNAANNALGQADIELLMGNDSIALAKYQQVAADHGYSAGNLANLNAAILLYKKGDYEKALSYLKDYSSSESVIGASAKSLEGDCYVNLKQYPQAIDCYKKAVKISDNNPHYTPAFLLKEATVLREQKDFKAEAAIYEQILKDYPAYGSEIGVDIKKYLERAQDAAK
ncbi:MAG: tetratricopeptide repeat protein [Duncaniella sp.]|uniref:tetratricopeptide repeat protein n=1 Tax=Duncaniella sp. TaxID=2518496 RepID=UPI0023D03DA9|nr:tetratricopeptide repeat protein [Duncaniella sp.]MDE6090658.1 tetratricopeptide repeat protein [Duncaniella sp.]